MQRVLPEARFVELDATHPIFHSFFEIETLEIVPQYYDHGAGRSSGPSSRTTTRRSG